MTQWLAERDRRTHSFTLSWISRNEQSTVTSYSNRSLAPQSSLEGFQSIAFSIKWPWLEQEVSSTSFDLNLEYFSFFLSSPKTDKHRREVKLWNGPKDFYDVFFRVAYEFFSFCVDRARRQKHHRKVQHGESQNHYVSVRILGSFASLYIQVID